MRILVVDDSRVFRRALQTELSGAGYEVLVATNGREALERLGTETVDLVTLDVDMPEMDGFQTCAEIRRLGCKGPGGADVRVLFVTSRESIEDRQRGFHMGATDFFHKQDFKAGNFATVVDAMLKPRRQMEGLTAMVVDDSAVARSLAAGYLRDQGVTVVEAEDGQQALDALARTGPTMDMILTDHHMPVMEGTELARTIRREFGWKDIPIIFLTTASEKDEVVRLFEAGATDYLHKPFTREELLARLTVHLTARQLNRTLNEFNTQLEGRIRDATHEIRVKNIQLEQRLREVTALNRISLALSATRTVPEVLEQVAEHGRDLMACEIATVYLLDVPARELLMAGTGPTVRVPVPDGAHAGAAQVGEGVLVKGGADAGTHFRQIPSADVRSRVSVPLALGEDVFAMIQAINKQSVDPFDAHDAQLLQTFAGIAGVALQNARLLDETRKLAQELRDSLEKERWLSIEKEKMGAYIPRHVVDEITRNREQKLALGGKSVRATILFSDIKGFTALSENLPPQKLVSFLNEYMTALTRVIEQEGGIVDKFIGDAIMAIFLPREAGDNYALRAVRAATGMQQQLEVLRTGWRETRPELVHLQSRIGINTGEVVAGNIGSQARMDYTVIGDNVNVASRIESNGIPGEVHISESTWEDVKDHVQARRLEPIHVKNRVQPVQIYSVYIPPVGDSALTYGTVGEGAS